MSKIARYTKNGILFLLVCIFIGPLVYVLYTSLIPFEWVNKIAPITVFSLDNYIYLFEKYPLVTWYGNTLMMTVIILVGNIATSLTAGYALSKLQFPGRNIIFNLILTTLMIPFQLLLTPLYIQVASFGWHNTMAGLTVPFLVSTLSIFVARQYYLRIPDDLIEAARVDGIGYISTFFKIIFPLSGTLITTLTILNFTSTWNAYLVPATFTTTTQKFVLSIGLNTIKDANFIRPNLTMAGVILLSIPIIFLFSLMQRYFIQGVASAGIKE